jgi:hypothetical protein
MIGSLAVGGVCMIAQAQGYARYFYAVPVVQGKGDFGTKNKAIFKLYRKYRKYQHM